MEAYRDQYAKLFNNGRNVVVIGVSVDADTALASWARDLQTPDPVRQRRRSGDRAPLRLDPRRSGQPQPLRDRSRRPDREAHDAVQRARADVVRRARGRREADAPTELTAPSLVLDRAPDAVLNDPTAAPARGRALLVELYDAAVAGAAPGPITTDALRDLDARPDQLLSLYAFGKAAHPMASAAVSHAAAHEASRRRRRRRVARATSDSARHDHRAHRRSSDPGHAVVRRRGAHRRARRGKAQRRHRARADQRRRHEPDRCAAARDCGGGSRPALRAAARLGARHP